MKKKLPFWVDGAIFGFAIHLLAFIATVIYASILYKRLAISVNSALVYSLSTGLLIYAIIGAIVFALYKKLSK